MVPFGPLSQTLNNLVRGILDGQVDGHGPKLAPYWSLFYQIACALSVGNRRLPGRRSARTSAQTRRRGGRGALSGALPSSPPSAFHPASSPPLHSGLR